MRRNAAKNHGYVLLLTLGIIALASIALAGLARHSLNLASTANESVAELQRRWGLLSIRHTLLDRSAAILDAQVPDELVDQPPWPKTSQLVASVALGDQHFTIVLADEDAKLDLNTIYARKRDRILPAIRNASRVAKTAFPDVRLAPDVNGSPAFNSWGEVFDLPRAFERANPIVTLAPINDAMTCWGSGHLNLRRATDTSIRETALLALPPQDVAGLIQNRKDWGGHGVEELLDDLELKRSDYLAVRRLLGTDSSSFSLWVQIDDGKRDWSYFYVDNGKPICFAW